MLLSDKKLDTAWYHKTHVHIKRPDSALHTYLVGIISADQLNFTGLFKNILWTVVLPQYKSQEYINTQQETNEV